jgi:hypothetical protein
MAFRVKQTAQADYDLDRNKPHQYRVLFTIQDDDVIILHIRHGRRRSPGEPH